MHRLLRRQLRKYLGVDDEVPAALQAFVAAVDAAYADFDSDRAMLERSLELSSQELSDARDEATAARRRLTDALESISEGFFLYDADDRMVLCNTRYRELFPAMADVYQPGLEFERDGQDGGRAWHRRRCRRATRRMDCAKAGSASQP